MNEFRDFFTKKFLYTVISLLLAAFVGYILLVIAFCLPVQHIRNNIKESYYSYYLEQDYFEWAYGNVSSRVDNCTDSLMLQESGFLGSGNHFLDAVNCSRLHYEGVELQSGDMIWAITNETTEGAEIIDYTRYWHGYLIWMKPLLMLLSPAQLRIFNMLMQIVSLSMAFFLIFKKTDIKYAIAFLISILALNPITTSMCFEYTSMYYLVVLGSIAVLCGKKSIGRDYWKIFLWIGIAAAYFDYLTYPIASLGIPLVLLLVLRKEQVKKSMLAVIKASIMWGVGYACMWSEKWIFASVITKKNLLADAAEAAKLRAGDSAMVEAGIEKITLLNVWKANFGVYANAISILVLIGGICMVVFCVVVKKNQVCVSIDKCLFLLVALYPFVWYAVLKNHSMVHYFFTHRGLSVMIFALAGFVAACLDETWGKSVDYNR